MYNKTNTDSTVVHSFWNLLHVRSGSVKCRFLPVRCWKLIKLTDEHKLLRDALWTETSTNLGAPSGKSMLKYCVYRKFSRRGARQTDQNRQDFLGVSRLYTDAKCPSCIQTVVIQFEFWERVHTLMYMLSSTFGGLTAYFLASMVRSFEDLGELDGFPSTAAAAFISFSKTGYSSFVWSFMTTVRGAYPTTTYASYPTWMPLILTTFRAQDAPKERQNVHAKYGEYIDAKYDCLDLVQAVLAVQQVHSQRYWIV